MLNNEQRRRTSQFEEVSERVRIAKENGLWRQNSWGGGFQQVCHSKPINLLID